MRSTLALTVAIVLSASVAFAMSPKDVYKKASPAVVLILASDDGRTGNGGTGSIITPEGKVITNAHVVLNESGQPYRIIYVFLKPPKVTGDNAKDLANRYKAHVLTSSPASELDLAEIQIENPPPNLPTIAFADPDQVEVGDQVVAIGHPEQGGLWTLTTGTVSTVIQNFNSVRGKDVFQTEASINRGNSGGPLLDANGNMIAVNTMIARQGAGGIAITAVNFSLKSSVAVKWLAGQGMGLAYAPKSLPGEEKLVVAVAPEAGKPAAEGAAPSSSAPASTAPAGPRQAVTEPPPATIVVAQKPPAKPEDVRKQGEAIGKQAEKEKLVGGAPLDPAKAKPTYHTEKRAYSLDDLRRQQMKELEDMMDEMRGKIREKKNDGSGLW